MTINERAEKIFSRMERVHDEYVDTILEVMEETDDDADGMIREVALCTVNMERAAQKYEMDPAAFAEEYAAVLDAENIDILLDWLLREEW